MRLDIFVHFAGLDIKEELAKLFHQGQAIMATVAELNTKLDALTAAADAERQEVLAVLTDLKAQIQALKDQIGAGSPATQADLDAIGARLDEEISKVQGIITDADKA